MKKINKLIKATQYIQGFKIGEINPIIAVSKDDATTRLQGKSGRQIIVALPEDIVSVYDDAFQDTISTVFFVIEKLNNAAKTEEKEKKSYEETLQIVNEILEKLDNDITGNNACELLSGLSIKQISMVPEYSLFGGWSGYSVEITFK